MKSLVGRLCKSARRVQPLPQSLIAPRTRQPTTNPNFTIPTTTNQHPNFVHARNLSDSATAQNPTMAPKQPKFELKTPKGTKDCRS